MKASLSAPVRRLAISLPALLLCCGPLTSCGLFKKKSQTTAANNGAYTGYSADGRYNPYPAGSQNNYQQYTEAPPPPSRSSGSSTYASSGSTKKSSSGTTSSKKKKSTGSGSSSTASKSSSSGSGRGIVHVVKPKDTLYGLAKKYHTTVSKIKSANHLTSDVIRDGQKLKIP